MTNKKTISRTSDLSNDEYQWGFTTEVDTELAPKGLNADIVRLISSKKQEPKWLLDWRMHAYENWTKINKSEGEPDFYIVRHLSSMGEFDEDDLFDNKNCNVGQIFQNEMSKEEREGLFQMWGDNFEVIYSQFRTLVE